MGSKYVESHCLFGAPKRLVLPYNTCYFTSIIFHTSLQHSGCRLCRFFAACVFSFSKVLLLNFSVINYNKTHLGIYHHGHAYQIFKIIKKHTRSLPGQPHVVFPLVLQSRRKFLFEDLT